MEEPFLKINREGCCPPAGPGGGLQEPEEVTGDILRYFQSGVMWVDFPKHDDLLLGGRVEVGLGLTWGGARGAG
jgi:hypothetical protein